MVFTGRLYNNPARADALETTAGAVRIDTEEKLVYTAPEVLLNQNISNKSDIWLVLVWYDTIVRVSGVGFNVKLFAVSDS